jgi:hypothetical protein
MAIVTQTKRNAVNVVTRCALASPRWMELASLRWAEPLSCYQFAQ